MTWKWVCVTAVSCIYVDRSTAGDHEFFRTQIWNCRIWYDWNCNGLLPLVMLAFSRPEKVLHWLLSQLLRYFFWGVCGNELEGLALVTRGQKSLFPHWPPSITSFAITYTDVAITPHFYCGQDCPQKCAQAHGRQMLPQAVLVTLGKLHCSTPGGISGKKVSQTKVLVVQNQKSIWDAIRSIPGAFPPYLGGWTKRDEYDACVSKGQTKSDQGRKASVARLSTPPSRAGRDASSGKKPRLWMPLFSLL